MLDNCQEQIFIAVLGTLLRRFLVENSQQSGRKGAFEIPTLQTRKVKDRSYSWDPREPVAARWYLAQVHCLLSPSVIAWMGSPPVLWSSVEYKAQIT